MGDRPKSLGIFFGAAAAKAWRPAADVYRTRDGWLLKFDLAGVCLEDVNVRVHGRRVTVTGQRHDSIVEEGCRYYSMEIAYSAFERTIELTEDIERARLSLDCQNGILLVRVNTKGDAS